MVLPCSFPFVILTTGLKTVGTYDYRYSTGLCKRVLSLPRRNLRLLAPFDPVSVTLLHIPLHFQVFLL